MDPVRTRSYLQAACAGLGFDIGEVWLQHNEIETGDVSEIDDENDINSRNPANESLVTSFLPSSAAPDNEHFDDVAVVNSPQGKIKNDFVMLYTSKLYDDQRNKLVEPEDDCTSQNEEMHILSPKIINAVNSSTHVVWANCQKQEGLLGRSDMRLHTAVGLPVLIDGSGNKTVVVMYSPNNIPSNDESIEYLQSICRSAASSSIECLLPVLKMGRNAPRPLGLCVPPVPANPNLGEGVVACCLSFSNKLDLSETSNEQHQTEALFNSLRKDSLDMPKLPSSSDLSSMDCAASSDNVSPDNLFDESSFGLWSAIMNTNIDEQLENIITTDEELFVPTDVNDSLQAVKPHVVRSVSSVSIGSNSSESSVASLKPMLPPGKRDRLEEFIQGFLGMSIFEAADVWIPCSGKKIQLLTHVFTSVKPNIPDFSDFRMTSSGSNIKIWSGAVGRAYGSGNPVWSNNIDIIRDSERRAAFAAAGIKTAFAVPIHATDGAASSVVFCAYSRQRHSSVPFVLHFVQQALRLVWQGLDQVSPPGMKIDTWKDVAPSDLGAMAADFEKQAVFVKKKRRLRGVKSPLLSGVAPSDHIEIEKQAVLVKKKRRLWGVTAAAKSPVPPERTHVSAPRTEGFSVAAAGNFVASLPKKSTPTVIPLRNVGPVTVPSNANLTSTSTDHLAKPVFWNLQQIQEAFQNANGVLPWCVSTVSSNQSNVSSGTNSAGLIPHNFNGTVSSSSFVLPSPASESVQNVKLLHRSDSNTKPFHAESDANPVHMSALSLSQARANIVGLNTLIQARANIVGTTTLIHNGWGPKGDLHSESIRDDSGKNLRAPLMTGEKTCRIEGCSDSVVNRKPYCIRHCGNRQCERDGCKKCAQGSTRYCIAHGGGRRCTHAGCDKGARDKFFCAAHGGGKRCSQDGCSKSAVGGSSLCTSHGGGKRCSVEGCIKSAQSTTNFCVRHGGGKKCKHEGCDKVARGRTVFCASHGGGVRCKIDGCNRVAVGKIQLCRGHGGGRSKCISPINAASLVVSTCSLVKHTGPH